MHRCQAVKNSGDQCTNSANAQYGNYCGVHKSSYLEECATRKSNQIAQQNEIIKQLREELNNKIKELNDPQAKKLFDALIAASDIQKQNQWELLKTIEEKYSATLEFIKEEHATSREILLRDNHEIKLGMLSLSNSLGLIDNPANQLEEEEMPAKLLTYLQLISCAREDELDEKYIELKLRFWHEDNFLRSCYYLANVSLTKRDYILNIIQQVIDQLQEVILKYKKLTLIPVLHNYKRRLITPLLCQDNRANKRPRLQ